jgi:polygalacturonase
MLSNITSSGASQLPSILSGVQGHEIEDVQISNVFLEQVGGGSAEMAALDPPEKEAAYPDPHMFGSLPATGIFARHIRNLVLSNVEVATREADARPAFWLNDVDGADFFRIRAPHGSASTFDLRHVKDFRSFGSRRLRDVVIDSAERTTI